jgi:hypothetical protein
MFWKGKIYLTSSGNRTTIPWFLASSLVINLYHSCRSKNAKWKGFLWHMAFHCCHKFLFLFPDQRLCIVKNMRICTYIYTVYIYITVYRLYISYRCYQIALGVKHFYTNRERWEDLTGYYQWIAGLTVTGRIREIRKNVLSTKFSYSLLLWSPIFP